eukprot:scaffold64879_cov39-Phaeocystis_antarctica.AAC.1
MFCCVSAISLDITFQALKAVRGICVKVVRPRAVMSLRLACGGRAAAHDTHARREAYTFSGAAQQRPFTPRRPVNADTQNSRKTLLLYGVRSRGTHLLEDQLGRADAGSWQIADG